MVKGYLTTKEVATHFRRDTRTISRWVKSKNGFPKPRFQQSGAQNLWAIDDIEAFEESLVAQN